jgi:DNA-binding IclR family transcriptional regulator
MSSEGRYAAPAAACAADLLILLARSQHPLSLAEISRELGRSKSLVFRVVRELEAKELVERTSEGRVSLGIVALELGGSYATRAEAGHSLRRILRELSNRTGETVNLGILRGPEVVYLLKYEGVNSIVTISHIGKRLPANCSALGKVLLAGLPDPEIAVVFGQRLPRLTSRSITSPDQLLSELELVRACGYAVDEGESAPGRCCLGVPVSLDGFAVEHAAVSISVDDETFAARRDELLAELLSARDRLDRESAAHSAIRAADTTLLEAELNLPSATTP